VRAHVNSTGRKDEFLEQIFIRLSWRDNNSMGDCVCFGYWGRQRYGLGTRQVSNNHKPSFEAKESGM
jgi:hypothetical protein